MPSNIVEYEWTAQYAKEVVYLVTREKLHPASLTHCGAEGSATGWGDLKVLEGY